MATDQVFQNAQEVEVLACVVVAFLCFFCSCSAMFEVYEATTLPAETLPPNQEIQGGALAIFVVVEFWSESEYPYAGQMSLIFQSNFGICWGVPP